MEFKYDYKVIDCRGRDMRFIGMNTSDGFRWCSGCIPDEKSLNRTYIIKGAAGTGKSTLMKDIAVHFENSGTDVVRFLCSSDPESLDGVTIGGNILILDGTAPHVRDAQYPGAYSELVCLGNFWNKQKLISNKDVILNISEEKARRFRKAYSYMTGMRQLTAEIESDIRKTVSFEKTEEYVSRIIRKLKTSRAHATRSETIVRAFGMKGAIRLTTLEDKAEKVITVSDLFGSGRVFLRSLADRLTDAGVAFITSPDPLYHGTYSDIFIKNERILFTLDKSEKAEKNVNMRRFIKKESLDILKGEIKLAVKCWESLRSDAERELELAAKNHFELERIYGSAMNFEAVNAYKKLLIKDIENRL